MFENYLKWREEWDLDHLLERLKPEDYEVVYKNYQRGFMGVDKIGRPMFIDKIGTMNINEILKMERLC